MLQSFTEKAGFQGKNLLAFFLRKEGQRIYDWIGASIIFII